MIRIEAPLADDLNVEMQVECPQCFKKMLLDVGLAPDTSNNQIGCPSCRNMYVALVPGPIVSGPFLLDQ
jgi:DNA-directed RNA polymerase subunit RPC12/RpoP